jgi:hypothetical protein
MNSSVFSPAMARRLMEAGCPLDPEVEHQVREAQQDLEIHQSGTRIQTWMFDLKSGGMGLVLSCGIFNRAVRNLHVQQFRVRLPWDDPNFDWLEDPHHKSPREEFYEFPRSYEFPRDVVLNHRIGCQGLLIPPGAVLDGYLLGAGLMPIPEQYVHRQGMNIHLEVFDSGGREYGGEFQVVVDREWKMARAKQVRASKCTGRLVTPTGQALLLNY